MNSVSVDLTDTTFRAALRGQGQPGEGPQFEELTKAVAENALLNSQVDRTLAARLLEAREELRSTQRAIQDLKQQFASLTASIASVIDITRLECLQQVKATIQPQPGTPVAATVPRIVGTERLLAMGANLRLNLGCGLKPTPDYFNVDARELPGVDMIADVRSLPFRQGTASEIYAAHLVEHFTQMELTTVVLPSWRRILKPSGVLRVVVPDAEAMIQAFSRGQYPFESLREVTYGSQDYPGNFHYTMFSRESLRTILRASGFVVGEFAAVGRVNGLCFEMEIEARKSS